MGFMDSMKAANLNFGRVESPDFQAAYITLKDDHFMIASAKETYEFRKEDVVEFSVLCAGGAWAKYKIKFADGKCGVITCDVIPPAQKGTGVSVAPIERYFGDLL